jgi:hypothetical protein
MTFDQLLGLWILAMVLRAVYVTYWRKQGLYFTISCDTGESLQNAEKLESR